MAIYTTVVIVLLLMTIFLYWFRKLFWSLIIANVLLYVLAFSFIDLVNNANISNEIISFSILVVLYVILPIMFVTGCIFLVRNTKIMYDKEGRSLVAKLSAMFGINALIIVIVLLCIMIFDSLLKNVYLMIMLESFVVSDLFFMTLFICYLIYSIINQMMPYHKKVDYIIVLGAGIRSEEVTPLLKSRLDKGIMYFEKYPQAKFVVSGGQGPDEPVSEAFAMAKYLRSQNIPDSQIIMENQSTNTYENMKYSKVKIMADWSIADDKPNVLFTTNNYHVLHYHVLRSMIYANKAKLKAHGVGAPTSYYFLPSAVLREYVALLVQNKFSVLLIILLIITFIVRTFWPIF